MYLSAENPMLIQNVPSYDVKWMVCHMPTFSQVHTFTQMLPMFIFFHHLQQSSTSHTPNHSVCCVVSTFGGTRIRRMCNKIKGPSKHKFHFTSNC